MLLLVIAVTLIHHTCGAGLNLRRWKEEYYGCPDATFQCDNGACIVKSGVCNGVQQCADGSDENEKQCGRIKRIQRRSTDCNLPPQPQNGQYQMGGCNPPTWKICAHQPTPGSSVRTGFISYKCNPGYILSGQEIVLCLNGWSSPFPVCSQDTTQESPSGCTLPPQPQNGQYELTLHHRANLFNINHPPSCQSVSGSEVSKFLRYTCDSGFRLSGSEIVLCDGKWSSPFPTCSQVACPPLMNPSREVNCEVNGTRISCDEQMPPGTIASVQCIVYYTNLKELSDFTTICTPNGTWTREVTPCIPECGEQNPIGQPLIAGGVQEYIGDFPWHAGIYKLTDKKFHQICGGSLISEQTIVSAAHCFWSETEGKALSSELFQVAVGQLYRDWDSLRNTHVQKSEIAKIIIYERYRGSTRNFEGNIAIIILKNIIRMTIAVRTICLDFKKEYNSLFVPGKTGMVVGWGITESMKQSDTLRAATLPYITFADCEKEMPEDFLPYLTSDKFCAGYHNGTSVCPGDSGGGYVSRFRDGKWYLMGVVSNGVAPENGEACNTRQYSTFTQVSRYYDFIENTFT